PTRRSSDLLPRLRPRARGRPEGRGRRADLALRRGARLPDHLEGRRLLPAASGLRPASEGDLAPRGQRADEGNRRAAASAPGRRSPLLRGSRQRPPPAERPLIVVREPPRRKDGTGGVTERTARRAGTARPSGVRPRRSCGGVGTKARRTAGWRRSGAAVTGGGPAVARRAGPGRHGGCLRPGRTRTAP